MRPAQPAVRPTPHLLAISCLQIGQVLLQARGRERGRLAAELQAAEGELARYRELPADTAAACAATAEKRAELARLRARLREHLDALQ